MLFMTVALSVLHLGQVQKMFFAAKRKEAESVEEEVGGGEATMAVGLT